MHTSDSICIDARHVIFCTGYELAKIVPATGYKILSTWAIATRPRPQPHALWPQRALIWEASEPYLYLRTTTDGRVVCGGEDEAFADTDKRDALTAQKTKCVGTSRSIQRSHKRSTNSSRNAHWLFIPRRIPVKCSR